MRDLLNLAGSLEGLIKYTEPQLFLLSEFKEFEFRIQSCGFARRS